MIKLPNMTLKRFVILIAVSLVVAGGVSLWLLRQNEGSGGISVKIPSIEESAKKSKLPFTESDFQNADGRKKIVAFLDTDHEKQVQSYNQDIDQVKQLLKL